MSSFSSRSLYVDRLGSVFQRFANNVFKSLSIDRGERQNRELRKETKETAGEYGFGCLNVIKWFEVAEIERNLCIAFNQMANLKIIFDTSFSTLSLCVFVLTSKLWHTEMSLLIDAFAIVNCFHRKHTSDFVKI